MKIDREELVRATEAGGLQKYKIYARLSGPGWLQSAITLGGGSLAGALFLVVIGGIFTWVLCDVTFNHVFSKPVNTELRPHPSLPLITTFSLITTGASWHDVACNRLSSSRARTNMIKSKFM